MSPDIRRRGPRPVAAVAVVATLVLGGCALGVQDRPVPIDTAPTVKPSAGLPSAATGRRGVGTTRSVSAFLVHDDRLIKVTREVAVNPGQTPAVAGLVAPVTERETHEGLRTALPARVTSLEVNLGGRAARVRLPERFDDLGVSEQILGVAQIVYTLTAGGTVNAVQLTEGGEPVAVPNGAGRLVPGPVDRSDYAVVAP